MNGSRFDPATKSTTKSWLALVSLAVLLFPPCFTVAATSRDSDVAQIQCVTPDGRLTPVLNTANSEPRTPARLTGDNTISCDLQEGDTTFIIPVAKTALLDRFTFVNLNAAASGEFNIAIADSRLQPNSPGWVQVDGIVPFSHKRLFNLSFLGTGARYVKLSFHVDKANRLTTLGFNSDDTQRGRIASEPPPPAAGPRDD